MSYRRNISLATAAAVIIHAVLGLLLALASAGDAALARMSEREEMMVVDLMPELPRERPARDRPERLVDLGTEGERPPEHTDRIAERNLRSQDPVEGDGDEDAPQAERAGPTDSIGQTPTPPSPAPEEPTPQPASAPDNRQDTDGEAEEAEAVEPAQDESAEQAERPSEAIQAQNPTEETAADPPQEQPTPTPPAQEEAETSVDESRPGAGVRTRGVLSFAAKRSELAPYLRSIQQAVERQWQAKVMVRYRGAGPARAVVRCAINPAGELESVRVADAGSAPAFAGICREAIRDAAPFGPFPFEVPDLLRNKNLEITWTFSYN